ncbi:protein GVQW3-like [Saccostrea cucullata]|uniref:protein GVQW3-like n=1 Tax=Saccostrea cuccullata TaxID=36930 RepID=UPI002ECFCCEF
MAEKSRFESGSSICEKGTFPERVEQRAVLKFCVDIGKTPTETHKFLKQSGKHCKVSRSLVFKWHKRFSDGRDSLHDDTREGRPSFRDCNAVKEEVRDVIDSDRRLTVREIAGKCGISKTTVHEILSGDLNMSRVCARWVPRILTTENLARRVLRRDLVHALRKKRPYLAANLDQVILHQDNAPAHISRQLN